MPSNRGQARRISMANRVGLTPPLVDVLIEVARPRRFRKRKVPAQAREMLLQLGYIEQASNGLVLTAEGAHYLASHLARRIRKKLWWPGG
jgi:hypothetical protein